VIGSPSASVATPGVQVSVLLSVAPVIGVSAAVSSTGAVLPMYFEPEVSGAPEP
jgi:hypothetical protein